MSDEPDLVGTQYVCRELGVNRSTIVRWIAATPPVLTPAQRVSDTGAYLFHRADVDRLKAERAASP